MARFLGSRSQTPVPKSLVSPRRHQIVNRQVTPMGQMGQMGQQAEGFVANGQLGFQITPK
jgi:hypothetical protein